MRVTSHSSNFLGWWGDMLSIHFSSKQLLPTNLISHALGNIGDQPIKNDSDNKDHMLPEMRREVCIRAKGERRGREGMGIGREELRGIFTIIQSSDIL